jgi:glyoxylase-like metal-dependent hydrolase (beta-lactamase superfamily II)/rhodanese-related sulfurtransferase
MILRQLFDQASCTYSYLLADGSKAVLIDPVFEQHARDAALIRELELELVATLDTHCHADHVTGAWLMKRAFGSRIGLSPEYGAAGIDLLLRHGDVVAFGKETLGVRAMPGHTSGCVAFVGGAEQHVFTGDALLIRSTGRTDFQGGDAKRLFRSIHEQLFPLADACTVYPAHDYEGRTSSTIGEERRYNPRIGGGAREEDFVGAMNNLGLPHPKQLAVALPANLRAGQPEGDAAPTAPDWGPVVLSYAGIPQIGPEWVAQHRGDVHVVDVRCRAEFDGELGHVEDATLLPLDELRDRVAEVGTDKPVIVVCQTGKRSALAATILRKAGVQRVANLAGGMVAWNALWRPV